MSQFWILLPPQLRHKHTLVSISSYQKPFDIIFPIVYEICTGWECEAPSENERYLMIGHTLNKSEK